MSQVYLSSSLAFSYFFLHEHKCEGGREEEPRKIKHTETQDKPRKRREEEGMKEHESSFLTLMLTFTLESIYRVYICLPSSQMSSYIVTFLVFLSLSSVESLTHFALLSSLLSFLNRKRVCTQIVSFSFSQTKEEFSHKMFSCSSLPSLMLKPFVRHQKRMKRWKTGKE